MKPMTKGLRETGRCEKTATINTQADRERANRLKNKLEKVRLYQIVASTCSRLVFQEKEKQNEITDLERREKTEMQYYDDIPFFMEEMSQDFGDQGQNGVLGGFRETRTTKKGMRFKVMVQLRQRNKLNVYPKSWR
jgi:hypothetical protein